MSALRLLKSEEVEALTIGLRKLHDNLKAGALPPLLDDLEPDSAAIGSPPLAESIESAVPAYVLDDQVGDAQDYFVFVATLHAAASEALESGCLLYYAPQP